MVEVETWKNEKVHTLEHWNVKSGYKWRIWANAKFHDYPSDQYDMKITFTRKQRPLRRGDRVRLCFEIGGSLYGTVMAISDQSDPESCEYWVKVADGSHCTFSTSQLTLAEPDDVID